MPSSSIYFLHLVSRTPHSCLSSFFTECYFSVFFAGSSPSPNLLILECPRAQSFIFLPFYFLLWWPHTVSYQLRLLAPKFISPFQTYLLGSRCIYPSLLLVISTWLCNKHLILNTSKTELLIFPNPSSHPVPPTASPSSVNDHSIFSDSWIHN